MFDAEVECELLSSVSFKDDDSFLRISSQVNVDKEKRLRLAFLSLFSLFEGTFLSLMVQIDNSQVLLACSPLR